MIEIERIKFMLDDQVIEVRALGSYTSKIWRALIKTRVGYLADVLTGNSDALAALDLAGLRDIANAEIGALIPLLRAALEQVNETYDIAPEIVQTYAPDAIPTELIERASNAQVMAALAEMIRVEFASPFRMMLSREPTGPAPGSTSSSLPGPNGALVSESSETSEPANSTS